MSKYFNKELEQELLGSILMFNVNPSEIGLKIEDFTDCNCQSVFSLILQFKEENPEAVCDITTLNSWGKNKTLVTFIASLTSNYLPKANIQFGVSQLKDLSKKRRIEKFVENAQKQLEDPRADSSDILIDLQDKIFGFNVGDKLPFRHYSMAERIDELNHQFKKNKEVGAYSTGFENLDKALLGGFHNGELIQIGGQTGTGKTTFAIQLACSLIEQNLDVLYVSLEMSAEELYAKILSLYMHRIVSSDFRKEDQNLEKYTLGFKKIQYDNITEEGTEFSKYNDRRVEILEEAKKCFNNYSKRLSIAEGTACISIEHIKNMVIKHYLAKAKQCPEPKIPIIIIDYAQILAPHNERATDTQNAKYDVEVMKQIAKGDLLANILNKTPEEMKTVVISIVAYNRNSNGETASEGSGRDSSALEYTGDLLFAVEPSTLKSNTETKTDARKRRGKELVEDEKKKSIKDIDIKILKYRGNVHPDKVPSFKLYHGAYFEEVSANNETTSCYEEDCIIHHHR